MEAMSYLHSQNIYYGDMKPENILVFKDYKIKIGDFGCSIKFPKNSKDDTTFYLSGLTKFYSLPEMSKVYD